MYLHFVRRAVGYQSRMSRMRFLLLTASLTMAEADTRHRARSSRLVRHEPSSLAHPNNATDAPPNSLLCSRRIGLLDAALRKSRRRRCRGPAMQHECKLCALGQCSLPRGARRGTQQHQRPRGEMCSQLVIRLVTQCAVRHTLDYAYNYCRTKRDVAVSEFVPRTSSRGV